MNAVSPIAAGQTVYAKIAAIQGELAKVGISKNRRNEQQNYAFRGIDDVYAALSPMLASHGLCVLPRMVSRERQERVSVKTYNGQSKESVLFYVTVEAEFDFVSADDGSCHTVRTFGEAMDSGDKATNKAMSAAYKYAAFMTFAIPTEGDNDADGTTHEVAGGQSQEGAVSPRTTMPDTEWSKLVSLIEATKSNTGALLKHYRISDLREMSQADYGDCIGKLNEKLAKQAKDETDAKAAQSTTLAEELGDAINF